MSSGEDGDGRAGRVDAGCYLKRRSRVVKQIHTSGRPVRVFLVEDNDFDARRLEASLRVLLGTHLAFRLARTAEEMLRALNRGFAPDAVVLDDKLPGGIGAEQSIERLRQAGFSGPIIVVSGLFTPARRQSLLRLGVAGIFDKDDVDALSLVELFTPPDAT